MFLLCLFIPQIPRETFSNGKPRRKQLFEFPSFNRSVDLRCFPLSYQNVNHGQIQSDNDTLCDLPTCRSLSKTNIKRLACFHTLHENCLLPTGACLICQVPLEKKVEELSQAFNKGLLDNQTDTPDESSDDDGDNTTDQWSPLS